MVPEVPTVYIMVGLPGAGKTDWIKNSGITNIVSADDLKDQRMRNNFINGLRNDPVEVSLTNNEIHEWSVAEAAKEFKEKVLKKESFILDGGGINNSYTYNLATFARGHFYEIIIVFIDTPVEVCLERNSQRNRAVPVPVDNIISKAVKLNKCLHRLKGMADDYIHIEYYTNENIFVDMDGTIAEYQHIPKDQYGLINFVEGQYFLNANPVKPMLDKLSCFEHKNIFILSAMPDSICLEEKRQWLDIHAPFIPKENRYFVGNRMYKAIMLRNLLKNKKIEYKDVTMIDDDHSVIVECNKVGINCIHPSKFLATEY